jgi:flagellar protein FlaJ
MFGNKKQDIGRRIVGFTKPKKFLFFTIKPKPIYSTASPEANTAAAVQQNDAVQNTTVQASAKRTYASKVAGSKKDLGPALVEIGIKMKPEEYVAQSQTRALIFAVIGGVVSGILFYIALQKLLILAPLIAIVVYMMSFNALVAYPMNKVRSIGNDVEKDILYAARDMIVSMRSGIPLFNAMATVSVGYGAASREFEKIIDRVQLGMPMEQAIDEVSAKSKSKTFKKLMLQASTSIKVGSDVIGAIQEVISEASQERVIELRRYGQRLNAVAMFYMLFGVIFPSMGLAVASIMSTFISIFPISNQTLILAVVGLAFLQFVFLKMVSSSRPSFAT